MTRLRPGYGGQGLVAAIVAIIAALGLAGFGIAKGTWAVGGSDSSCYALMADAFAHARWQPTSPLAIQAPWPDAARSLAPGGFIPSPVRADAASPICAPGLSVLMAPLVAIAGPDAIFVLSPIAGALLVWCAFLLARRLAGGLAGATAAVLVAASPIVLFQVVQPMNDVVTAALWLAALAVACRGGSFLSAALLAGILTGLAILVRPNLAPVAIVVLITGLALAREPRKQEASLVWRQPLRWGCLFMAGSVPAIALLLVLNQILYGAPFGSGYGSASALFSAGFFSTNVTQLLTRIYETQTPFPLLALLAPLVFAERARAIAWSLLAAAAAVIACYLFYRPYPEWWYLRFELPAVVLLLVVASAVAVNLAQRANMTGVIPLLAVVLAILSTRVAGGRQVFKLQQLEGRYRDTASLVHDRLPENAVLITVWQSGGVRFHAGREAVLWDSLDPAWIDRAVAWLTAQGRTPYILLERPEERQFRERFRGASELGGLDWPPRFDLARQARIYDPADRARYLRGESYATENIRPK
ncbi:MAG: glycosyltransferase family 39 protein [Acidobacteriota bacterium]|nr:glycosyltransferase family 39 protein [Acidobacteriota bacterium]